MSHDRGEIAEGDDPSKIAEGAEAEQFDPWSLPPEGLERLVGRKLPRTLWQARAAFLQEFEQLYREHPGKYVAYHGATRIGEPRESDVELWQECLATGLPRKQVNVIQIHPDSTRPFVESSIEEMW
jgi:hypothetical protein